MLVQYIVGLAFIAGNNNGGGGGGAFTCISRRPLTSTNTSSASSPFPLSLRKHLRTSLSSSSSLLSSSTVTSSSSSSLESWNFALDCQSNRGMIRRTQQQQLFLPATHLPLKFLRHTAVLRRKCDGIRYYSCSSSTRLFASEQFYDDFEGFGELGGASSSGAPAGSGGQSNTNTNNSNNNNDSGSDGKNEMRGDEIRNIGRKSPPPSSTESFANNDTFELGTDDDAVMKELRERMNDLSKMQVGEERDNVSFEKEEDDDDDVEEEEDEEEEEEEEEEEYEDVDSGSALPDLEGSTISSIDDLIGFAQAKARLKKANMMSGSSGESSAKSSTIGGTWEDENWARPIPIYADDDEEIDFDNLLEGGIILIANPAKFCSDLAANTGDEYDGGPGSSNADNNERRKSNSFLGGLFDDPFPSSFSSRSSSSSNKNKKGEGISPALLAKFGITLPPSPDLGPDRRADLLPVVLLIDRDPVSGCRAVLMNRRTGNLMGDLPSTLFDSTQQQQQDDRDNSEEGLGGGGYNPSSPHPLSAFMIQPLWWAGSSPGGAIDNSNRGGGGGINAIRMVHACPYVNGSVPLARSDGLYWGGNPVQAQEAMRDSRLEKPLSGFDFKFFIQTTRWLPSQLEQEIKDGVWYLATVSKEVLFRSRDRLGAKRAKPLWTEIIELLGEDYRHIRDQLYGDDE